MREQICLLLSIISDKKFVMSCRGSIDLPHLLPWLGSSQIQVLSAITIVSLVIPHALTIMRVKETPMSEHA